ncbi:MAG: hypothetical protein R3E90_12970 [Marinicella sp.]|nr:hypothetical protein [Xanthomonadales bacterium]
MTNKTLFILLMVLTCSVGFATKGTVNLEASHVDGQTVEISAPITAELETLDLLSIPDSSLSDAMLNDLNLISMRPHFYFHTLQQCQAVPECNCVQEGALWACYIY